MNNMLTQSRKATQVGDKSPKNSSANTGPDTVQRESEQRTWEKNYSFAWDEVIIEVFVQGLRKCTLPPPNSPRLDLT